MTPARFFGSIDPLVRLLLVAIVLATILPVTGEGRVIARFVSDAAIFLLFFLNGLRLPRRDVMRGIGNWRFLMPLFIWCFAGMGLAGWGLWQAGMTILPEQVALGLLFLGVLPSTVQSATAYSSLAGGNVATSVVAAAVINVAGVFVTAPLFALAAGTASTGIDIGGLERIATILLLPFALGQLAQGLAGGWVKDHKPLVSWMDRSSIAIAVYVAFSGAVEQGLWSRVDLAAWAALVACVAVFLLVGFGGSWLLGGLLRLERSDHISFLFAGAQKSIALGAPLATVLFPPAIAGLLLLPVLVYHLLQLVLSAPLANRLNPHPAT
ncbi:bile acid:sodium symporter family protein [Alteraurantiacibacter buctensis]|uniref:Bile acid:sodium symporter n=1 Tax=Alteraurantiacibacter buctensis TaxID=1503981 RepID=A0A844YXH6_9SPHN|nr:bile acid:sodium symporter family protein [Alteraurantiacibacter buctensis]MXO71660.1 bile acid:sodium symporter [Alteraurantiacibacter buctensis]